MHHLDEVPGAGRAGVDVAALGAGIAFLAARRARDIAQPRSERREDRIEVIHGRLLAADHHAIAALDAPDAAGRAAIDVANALLGQLLGAADVVLVEGVAAVDDDVVRLQQAAEMFDRLFGDPAGRQHQPNDARLLELADELLEIGAPGDVLADQRLDGRWIRSNTTHWWPLRVRRRTMLPPMRPKPIMPICIRLLLLFAHASACRTASLRVVNPAATCEPRCTRRTRRSRSASTSKSPRASAALTTPKVYFWSGTWRSAASSQVICRNTPVFGPPL